MSERRAIPLPEKLRPWIAEVNVERIRGGVGAEALIDEPDHATTLVWRAVPGGHSDVVVMGPRTRALFHVGVPGPWCVKARVRHGRAALLLGGAMREFVDRAVPLSEVRTGPAKVLARALIDRQLAPSDPPAFLFLQRIGDVLQGSQPTSQDIPEFRADLVRDAAALLSTPAYPDTTLVRTTAQRLHISERHLRSLFVEAVGLSPKRFSRIDRVRKVLSNAKPRHLAQLAADAGYYDHAHLTAEFREFVGVPPGAFVRGELPDAIMCERPSGDASKDPP